MANLDALVIKVHQAMDHNPDLAAYKNATISRLNEAYREILASGDFLFAQRAATITTYAPVVGTSTAVVSVTNGAYAVPITGITPSLTWEGATFYGPDGYPYEVARVNIATSTMYLSVPYAGTTAAAQSSWAIRWLSYALPADCDEPLSFTDQQTFLQLPFIARSRSEAMSFQANSTGGPQLVVDTVPMTDRAPDFAPTLTVALGGTLVASTTYAICYTFTKAGRESPPSPLAQIATTGADLTIAVAGMEDTRVGGVTPTGIYKNVYMRNVTRGGRWLKIASDLSEATLSYTFNNDPAVSRMESNELQPQEPLRQYMRLHPPASDSRQIEVRYTRRVRDLASGGDTPIIPEPFDSLIYLNMLLRASVSVGALQSRQAWKEEAARLDRMMRERWLTRATTANSREMMYGVGGGDAWVPMFNGAIYTYTG